MDLKPKTKPEARERPNKKLLSQFYGETEKRVEIGLYMLVVCSQLVSVQLNHHHLSLLLRLVDSLVEIGAFLSSDSVHISVPQTPPCISLAVVFLCF